MARVFRIAFLVLFALSLVASGAFQRISVYAHEGDEEETKNESSASWTEWAKEKISGGLGTKEELGKHPDDAPQDKSKDAAKKTEDAAEGFTERAGQVASDTRQKLGEKTKDASDKAKEAAMELMEQAGWVKDKIREAYERGKTEVEEGSKEQTEWAKDKTKAGYDTAKVKTGETLDRAGKAGQEQVERAKEKAKSGSDAAKSKAEETMDTTKSKTGETLNSAKEKLSSTLEKDVPIYQDLRGSIPEEEL